MKSHYKVIISNKNIYKEVSLLPDMEKVTIGTVWEVDVRLRKELFFGKFLLTFTQTENNWNVICSDNLYFSFDDVRKLMNYRLEHGAVMKVCYQDSDHEAFTLSFLIDFDYEKKDYNRKLDISDQKELKIGGTRDVAIRMSNEYLGLDTIILRKSANTLLIIDIGCRYGVYVNGIRVSLKQEITDHDFFSIVGYSFYYCKGYLYTTADPSITVNGLSEVILGNQETCFVYPKFNRNTRIQYEIPNVEIEIQQPASKPELRNKSLILTLLPAAVMLAMTIVLRGIMGGGGTFVIYSAVSMSMGIMMSIITYIQDKKSFQKETVKRNTSYQRYLEDKEALILESRSNELRIRRWIYESLDNSLKEVNHFGRRLFEKDDSDQDFLQIYLGTGRIESANQILFHKQEFVDTDDPLSMLPEQMADKYRYLDDAPIISDFKTSCGIGVVGSHRELKQILINMTLDLVIRHFYKDVRLAYILEESYVEELQWIRWLRNLQNEQLDMRNIVCDEESKNILLEHLYVILSGREAVLAEKKESVFEEQYVVFVTNMSSIRCHPMFKYIKNCGDYGFTFVFLEKYEEELPVGCTEIIRLQGDQSGYALKAANGEMVSDFIYPMIEDKVAEHTALRLGAIFVEEVTLEGQLTKHISMFELLGIISVEDLDFDQRWKHSRVYETMAAPIGVKSNHEVVALDVSDKSDGHGPHGLVAGTTGSGKSEILQTYILSMATLFHPYDVGFVMIDFKGGGMANQFKKLPHLIGTITNIDGREIRRFLLSIKAELVKRQELFSEADVNHINDYIRLFKAGKVVKPVPHLIMIVDEFAELKAEYPDFMKELISAARIGRTLGVHLILATQKPAGVVDAQIWSNSKFKLCLKVQTKEDSNEVLKTPLAAEIIEPGRAYFQVGNNEIFVLFQSAYSGANVPEGNEAKENIYSIYERNFWGKKTLVYTNKKEEKSANNLSQLQAIVDYVDLYCTTNQIGKLPGICLPSLDQIIRTDALPYDISEKGFVVPIGILDDPKQQRQGIVQVDLSKENVYLVGSAQMGKTVFLQTMAYGIIRKFTPKQVNMYMVDCGSMVLRMFAASSYVGGVVLSNEDEKCKNLFKLLCTTIVERKKILSGKGVGNFAAYLDAGYQDMPLLVVMIDNMAAFKEYFPDQADQLNGLTREAQGVGISFVVTAATTNALNYRTQSNFGKKFVLHCNDTTEYSNLFGHCKETPREYPGSALMMLDKRILEWQAAIFGTSDKEAKRSQELMEYIERRNTECDGCAVKIPMVPEKLMLAESMNQDIRQFRNPGIVPIGMDFATVEYSVLNINLTGVLALLGDSDMQMQFVSNFLQALAKNIVFQNVEAIVIDNRQRTLESIRSFGFVRNYTSDAAEGMALLSDFYEELYDRENADPAAEFTTLILVMNHAELFQQICADKNASKELASGIKKSNGMKTFILLTQIENAPVGFQASEALKTIRDEKQGILFAPLSENKFFEVSGRIRADSRFDKSIGYRFEHGTYSKIKLFE